jgi:hypothetical protein
LALLTWLSFGVFFALAAIGLRRATERFCVSVRGGGVLLVRGRIHGALLDDLRDVARRDRVASATLRALASGGRTRLEVRGVKEGTAQRFRNVFGLSSEQALRGAPPPRTRNLGQVLGLEWLAWRLHRPTRSRRQ